MRSEAFFDFGALLDSFGRDFGNVGGVRGLREGFCSTVSYIQSHI